jgi:hypothetical protein
MERRYGTGMVISAVRGQFEIQFMGKNLTNQILPTELDYICGGTEASLRATGCVL